MPAFAESVSEGDVRFEEAAGDWVKEDEVRRAATDVWQDPGGCSRRGGREIRAYEERLRGRKLGYGRKRS